jgi:geranylgeranyl diphosphate synthase type I
MKGEELLNRHLDMVDEEIKKVFESRSHPAQLYDMMKYHLGWLNEDLEKVEQYRGKRFRPTLCLLVYNALSGVYDKALPAAAAIELIHNFSLIHDDIEDMDEERRHKATVWKLWGISQAINVGDGMHVLANLAALRLADLGVTSEKVVESLRILNGTIITLCEGQYLDMSFEDRLDITIDMYLDMIRRKTAALVEASAWIGATLATEDTAKIRCFRNFGRNIGLAFQIIDDILGIWEKSEYTGKPKASDVRNRKKTLPVLYAMERASNTEKKTLKELYSKARLSENDVDEVLKILESSGAYEFSKKIAENYEETALRELSMTEIRNEAMDGIRSLAEFLVKRKY